MPIDEKGLSARSVLGLDIGGTEIKAALLNFQGDIIASQRRSTPRSLPDFKLTLKDLIENLHLEAAMIRGAGIGCKGIIDPHTTEILALPGDLNYLERHRLDEIITPLIPVPCPVAADNDARVALEGERRWGAARDRENAIMLTLGTGVGGAVLAGGNILRGAGGAAGHLGHVTVDPNGAVCICGNQGCLETIFSARALESEAFAAIHRGVRTDLLSLSPQPPSCVEIFEFARKGDKVAQLIVERAITVLGGTVAGLVHALDPEVVILGGRIVEAGDYLLDRIQQQVDWRTKVLVRRRVPIVKAQVADPSGVVGAAAMAIQAAADTAQTSSVPRPRA